MKKIEKLIILALLLLAIIVFSYNKIKHKDSLMVNVTDKSNNIIFSFNIYEDNYYDFKGDYGEFHIEVKSGKCRAVDVDCPNQICTSTGWISASNPVPIICIPNGIAVIIDEN